MTGTVPDESRTCLDAGPSSLGGRWDLTCDLDDGGGIALEDVDGRPFEIGKRPRASIGRGVGAV